MCLPALFAALPTLGAGAGTAGATGAALASAGATAAYGTAGAALASTGAIGAYGAGAAALASGGAAAAGGLGTLGAFSLGTGVLGTGLSTIGAVNQARAAREAALRAAEGNAISARFARERAADALKRGGRAEVQLAERVAGLASRQETAFARNNLVVGSGSAGRAVGDTLKLGSIDLETIRENAAREAFGFNVQEFNFNTDRQLALGRASSINPGLLGATRLARGATNTSLTALRFKRAGVFS